MGFRRRTRNWRYLAGTMLAAHMMAAVVACGSAARNYVSAHPDLPQTIATAMRRGTVIEGMTPEQVRLVWGEPATWRVDGGDASGNENLRWFRYETHAPAADQPALVRLQVQVEFENNRVVRVVEQPR